MSEFHARITAYVQLYRVLTYMPTEISSVNHLPIGTTSNLDVAVPCPGQQSLREAATGLSQS